MGPDLLSGLFFCYLVNPSRKHTMTRAFNDDLETTETGCDYKVSASVFVSLFCRKERHMEKMKEIGEHAIKLITKAVEKGDKVFRILCCLAIVILMVFTEHRGLMTTGKLAGLGTILLVIAFMERPFEEE